MTDINGLELTKNSQSFFDCFNNVIMSNDTRVFNKLIGRALLYEEVKDIPGDIVECGVFKGSGIYTFLKLKRLFNSNSSKRVIGFDNLDEYRKDKRFKVFLNINKLDTNNYD